MPEPDHRLTPYEQSWLEAHASLLFEWDSYTDKERVGLMRRHRTLAQLLDQVSEQWRDYRDATLLEAQRRLRDQERQDRQDAEYLAVVQILDDGGVYRWEAFPEVNRHRFQEGQLELLCHHGDSLLLIRSLPSAWVGEVRSVAPDDPLLEQATFYHLRPAPTPDPQPTDVGAGGDWAGVPTPYLPPYARRRADDE